MKVVWITSGPIERGGSRFRKAFKQYKKDIEKEKFPGCCDSFPIKDEEFSKLVDILAKEHTN